MATDDQQRLVAGVASAPATFTVPGNGQIRPKTVFAAFDGTNAAVPFTPALKVTSDAGKLVGIYPASASVAAGASANVSWFPGGSVKKASTGSGIQFDVDNVGDWLEVETTGLVATPFSQPESSHDGATSFGMALNIDNGLLITTPPDSFFNSGEPVLEVDQLVPSGDRGAQGIVVQVADSTPNGTNGVQGIQVRAGADGSQEVDGLTSQANMGADGTADAVAGSFGATNRGSGREIGVAASAGNVAAGANALCYLGLDGAGNTVFYVDSAGNIHIPTTANLFRDL